MERSSGVIRSRTCHRDDSRYGGLFLHRVYWRTLLAGCCRRKCEHCDNKRRNEIPVVIHGKTSS
jgi:hypothetical protein